MGECPVFSNGSLIGYIVRITSDSYKIAMAQDKHYHYGAFDNKEEAEDFLLEMHRRNSV